MKGVPWSMGPSVGKLGVGLTWRSHYAIAAKYLMWFAYSLGSRWLLFDLSGSLMRGNPRVGGGCLGTASSALALAPTLTQRVESSSASEVQEIPTEEVTRRPSREEGPGVPEVPRKWQAEDSADHRKKDRCKLHQEADRSAAKGKGPADTKEEPPTPRRKPKSMRELCSASAGVDGWDYHAIRMLDFLRNEVQRLKEGGDPDAVAAVEARALEAQSLVEHLRVELDKASRCRESMEVELEGAREELVNLQRQLADSRGELTELRGQLDDSESWLRSARTQDTLRADLPKRAIEDYNKSPEFEMGIIWMGRGSLEYGYQLALARLRAQHPGVEIEQDSFAPLPKDDDVPMADEQPFDDSLPPPEE
ncbi:hypothetical protein B296_00058847 [Ensete ventricosum]|uniref:Uncharacterized protein n=1 Tax=Ensete ventricosum TaxID=4639 RepID=A0A426XK79_ENSVE|nr:hypothetical protein B296_00058847 [Ensete ventricosum]